MISFSHIIHCFSMSMKACHKTDMLSILRYQNTFDLTKVNFYGLVFLVATARHAMLSNNNVHVEYLHFRESLYKDSIMK